MSMMYCEDCDTHWDSDWLERCYCKEEKQIDELLAEVKRLRKRNEWLEEVVALAQEHGAIDLSDYGWPQWEEE